MTFPADLVVERAIPVWKRPSIYLAAGLALLGGLLAAYLIFVAFHYQDRRPPRELNAPEFGQPFAVLDFLGEPMARITVTGGERNNYRAAGGTDAEHEYVELFVTFEAVKSFDPGFSGSEWQASFAGEDVGRASLDLEPSGRLTVGQSATGSVRFSGVPANVALTVTYQRFGDDRPVLEIDLQ